MCDGLAKAMRAYGVPEEILTDNGKVFTGRFNQPPVEVLFDRICRENGVTHRLTQPRSPTTTGKIERFHRSLRLEFRTDRVFADLAAVQAELDVWVADYNHRRPHQGIGMDIPVATLPPWRSGSCDLAATRDRRSTRHRAAVTVCGSHVEPARSESSA